MRRRNSRRVIVLDASALPGLDVLAAPYEVEQPVPWSEAEATLMAAPPSAVVLVAPFAGVGAGRSFPRLHDLLRRFPSVTVVAAMELDQHAAPDAATLLEWGVSELIDVRTEATPRGVHARLRQAHARPLKRRLETALSDYVSAHARTLLLGAAEVAVEGGGAPEMARLFRVTPRTLTERCVRARIPAPRQVQTWMRVLLACMLLDDPGRTVYAAAYATGYSTDRSLRRAISGLLGVDTTTLRQGGAFGRAMARFNQVLRETREAARERRRLGMDQVIAG